MAGSSAAAPTWRLTDLGVRYRRASAFALSEATVAMTTGAVALLGPNGAGKTTLFRVLSTTIVPTTGTFEVAGISPVDRDSREQLRRRLGYLPQNFRALGGYTCEELLAYVAWLRRMDPTEVPDAIQTALAAVGLDDRSRVKVKTLSGGMRQRLGLAQALVNKPSLLLLDEPTVGLDPEQRATFMAHLETISQSTSVLLATHLVEDVAVFASEVIVLDDGHVTFDGSLREFCGQESDSGRPSGQAVEEAYLRAVKARRVR